MPIVNVIIPIYNMAHTLPRAISSVQTQSLTNWVITIVDDLSPDHSLAVAQQFARHDPRIHVIAHASNKGPAAARNTGAAAQNTEYLAFLDADDEYHPDFLKITTTALNDEQSLDAVKVGVQLSTPAAPDKMRGIHNSLITNTVVRRSVFRFLGGFPEDPAFRGPVGGEDIAFNYLLSPPFAVKNIDEPYYLHHIVEGERSHTTQFLQRNKMPDGSLDGTEAIHESERLVSERIHHLMAVRDLKIRLFIRRLMDKVSM